MATIGTLGANDSGSTSRTTINTNFTNLNTDKMETSVLSTDGTLAGNSDTEVPSEKAVKTYVDAQFGITVETTAATTHSLTTTAGQVVCVWAKGTFTGSVNDTTVSLKYNSITKDSTVIDLGSATYQANFALMYTETPGAATQDITVTVDYGSVSDVVIMVQIIG